MRPRPWRALLALGTGEGRRAVAACAQVSVCMAGLRIFGLKRWQTLLAKTSPIRGACPPEAVAGRVARCRQAVTRAGRNLPWQATCLPRSLVLWWMLRREGIDAELRIGVRKASEKLEAHAWVEVSGIVANDQADVREAYIDLGRAIQPFARAIQPAQAIQPAGSGALP